GSFSVRYFCGANQHLGEYLDNGDGTFTLLRDTGVCCQCLGSGSGSGGPCCSLPDTFCVTFTIPCSPYWTTTCQVTFVRRGATNYWDAQSNSCSLTGIIRVDHYPDGTCVAAVDLLKPYGPGPNVNGLRLRGFGNLCDFANLFAAGIFTNVYLTPYGQAG